MTKTVTMSLFQPFGDGHQVVRLGHPYNPTFITALKAALAEAPPVPGHTRGGWLPDWKTWFCEQAVLPFVRWRLEQAGFTFVEGAPPGAPPPPPPPPRRDLVDVQSLIARWYREMAFKFHPDRDGSHAAMVAINIAHDRLKEMIEG
jgi:hypothetical protein